MINEPQSGNKNALLGVIVGLLAIGIGIGIAYGGLGKKSNDDRVVPPTENGSEVPKDVTVEGEYVCLAHRDTSGPQTLECALGIKTDDRQSYALDLGDLLNSDADTKTPTGSRIRVSGTLVPIEAISSDYWQKYDVNGIMRVSSMEKI